MLPLGWAGLAAWCSSGQKGGLCFRFEFGTICFVSLKSRGSGVNLRVNVDAWIGLTNPACASVMKGGQKVNYLRGNAGWVCYVDPSFKVLMCRKVQSRCSSGSCGVKETCGAEFEHMLHANFPARSNFCVAWNLLENLKTTAAYHAYRSMSIGPYLLSRQTTP